MPRFKDKNNRYILSNTRYFDGIEKFRAYQDRYSESMKIHFKCLNRGIKFSKSKHIEMRSFYSLLNKELDTKDISQVIAKAKNSELLEIKIKAIEKTLQVYKNYNSKNELQKEKALVEAMRLAKEIEKLNDNKEIYQEAISLLSQQYKIPQYAVNEAIRECKAISKEREHEL